MTVYAPLVSPLHLQQLPFLCALKQKLVEEMTFSSRWLICFPLSLLKTGIEQLSPLKRA